jgi:hypothetical protein
VLVVEVVAVLVVAQTVQVEAEVAEVPQHIKMLLL